MKTQIVIRDFERTENLETYLKDKIEDSISPYLQNYTDSVVTVKVEEDRHRTMARKPHFQCEVRVQVPGSKSVLTVRKNGDHFYDCVQDVTETLREVMRRQHRRNSSLYARRRKTLSDIPYNMDREAAS